MPQGAHEGQLVLRAPDALAAVDCTHPVELPIIIPVAKGIWRSLNYTFRDHYVESNEHARAVCRLLEEPALNQSANSQNDKRLGESVANSKNKQSEREKRQKKQQHEVELQRVLDLDGVHGLPKGNDIFVPSS